MTIKDALKDNIKEPNLEQDFSSEIHRAWLSNDKTQELIKYLQIKLAGSMKSLVSSGNNINGNDDTYAVARHAATTKTLETILDYVNTGKSV